MINVKQFIGRIRDQYVLDLSREIATYNQTFNQVQTEALLQHEDPALPRAFAMRRVDIISTSRNYSDEIHCKAEDTLYFRPTKLSLRGRLKIQLEPFTWNEADIECSRFDTDARILQQWAYRWIEDDSHTHGDNGLRGCAHSISQPVSSGSRCRFTVDFGSADVECFVELMQVLYRLGVVQLRVFSRYLYQ